MEFNLEVVQEFIDVSRGATTPDEINSAILCSTALFGGDYLAATTLSDFSNKVRSPISVVTYPKAWQKRYADQDYHLHDPVVGYLQKQRMPFYWGEIERATMSDVEQQILEEGKEFGASRGLSLSVPLGREETAAMTIAGDNLEESDGIKHMFHLIATYYYQRLRFIKGGNISTASQKCKLTLREVEVLQWFSVGKTAWDTGEILGISERTVRFHLESVRKKYGVTSTVHASSLAIARSDISI